MLEQIQQFFSENTTVVIMAVVALVSIVAFFLLRRNTGVGLEQQQVPYPTPWSMKFKQARHNLFQPF